MTPGARLLLALVLVLGGAECAQAGRLYEFKEQRLPNGLRVLTLQDHSSPVVAVQVWYHVGSKDEAPDRQGFAHLFEHLMFRGTDRVGGRDHNALIQKVGGSANAYTTFDATYFVSDVPSNQLELVLWLEAERMAFLRIDEANFRTERKVVEEERRNRSLNRPYGLNFERALAGIFRVHPYRWDTIGRIPHLRAASLGEVKSFWARYYLPNNAVLVIAGDIEHRTAGALAERYFGWIRRGPAPPRQTAVEPPQKAARDILIPEALGTMPIVGVVVRSVPYGHPDVAALAMLTRILAGGEGSRLYRDLMWQASIAHNVYPFMTMHLEQEGLSGVAAQVMEPGREKEAIAVIEAQLDRLIKEPVESRELERARLWLRRAEASGRLTVADRAGTLGLAATLGRLAGIDHRLERIGAVTAADLQRVARLYFRRSNRNRIRVEPGAPEKGGPADAPKPSRRAAPRDSGRAGLVRPETFPTQAPVRAPLKRLPLLPQERRRLPNGMEVVVVTNREVPLVRCYLALPFGSASEASGGAAQMTLTLLSRSTALRDATTLLDYRQDHGITLEGSASADGSGLTASCLRDQLGATFRLLAETVIEPGFDEAQFGLMREMRIRVRQDRLRYASVVADEEFARQVFGKHPYGRPAEGRIEDLRRLTREHLKRWWTTHGRPDAAVLYVAGDVEAKRAFALAKEHFGRWKAKGTAPRPKPPGFPDVGMRRIVIVDRPGSAQSEIRVGHLALTRAHPDWHTARLLSQMLGGSMNSRLNLALRWRHGLTYWADGGFNALRMTGVFAIRTATKTSRTAEAIRVLLDVLADLRKRPPPLAEVRAAYGLIAGSLAGRWETAEAVVADLWLLDSLRLSRTHIQEAIAAYARATPADIHRVARAHVDPDAVVIVVVGDAARIRADLEKIAPVTLR